MEKIRKQNALLAILFVTLCITDVSTGYSHVGMRIGNLPARVGRKLSMVCHVKDTSDDFMLQWLVEKVTGINPIGNAPWGVERSDGLPYNVCNDTELNPAVTRMRGDNYSVAITKDEEYTYLTLNISDVQFMDSGWWGCKIVYHDGQFTSGSGYFEVKVDGPLSYVVIQEECCTYAGSDNFTLSQTSPRKTFLHGNKTDLTCQIGLSGYKAPTPKMTINSGGDIIKDLTKGFSKHYYEFSSTTVYGAGLVDNILALFYHDDDFRFDIDDHDHDFHCTAELPGWQDKDASFTILVESPPIRAACKETTVYGVTGSLKVAIVCHVKGNPAPKISWTGPLNQAITSKKDITIKDHVRGVVTISSLLIKKVTEGDHGLYTMTASNKYGTDEASAKLVNELPPPSSARTLIVANHQGFITLMILVYSML